MSVPAMDPVPAAAPVIPVDVRARRGRRVRRVVLRVARFAPVVALAAAGVYARFVAPVGVQVHRVDLGDVVAEAFGRGTVESEREAQVGFDLVGRLSDVLVDEGTRVTLGQELARLIPDQLRADFRAASSGVAAARTTLARLSAEERHARAALDAADREAQRASGLSGSGAIAARDLDVAQDQLRLTRADLDRILAQRAEATRGIDVATGGVEQRRATVLRATLLAPFDGLVTRRLRDPGDTIAVGTTVLHIVDTEHVYVRAWIDESALPRVHAGQRVVITVPGSDADVPGTVARVGWEADRQTHEVQLDVTASAPLGRIAIGQRADVRVELGRSIGAVRIPTVFVQRNGSEVLCAVDEGGRVSLRHITVGAVGRDHVEVTSGLREGDTAIAPRLPGGTVPVGRRWVAR